MPGCQACVRGSWTLTKTRALRGVCGGTLAQITAAQPSVGWMAIEGDRSAPGILLRLVNCVVVAIAGRGVGRTQASVVAGVPGAPALTATDARTGMLQAVRQHANSSICIRWEWRCMLGVTGPRVDVRDGARIG